MRSAQIFSLAVLASALAVSPAGAQEQKPFGITMAYPASVGALLRVGRSLAIRPEVSLSGGTSETSSSSFATESDSWTLNTGVSVLIYLKKYDDLRTYFTPRFNYAHGSTTTDATGFVTTNPSTTTTLNAYGFSGSFGGEYALGRKFGVFGEVGFGFSHQTTKSNVLPTELSGNSWGSRAGVGVIFFP
ncbi:MAG TPA: hypothetical protein VFT47_05635 [Vicinamibacterales bacterium]|nr:hypothetical protein [Vicinamibacterales bacterium]